MAATITICDETPLGDRTNTLVIDLVTDQTQLSPVKSAADKPRAHLDAHLYIRFLR